MPYILKKVKDGYKVCKKDKPTECFSNNPLSLTRAKKQKTAIILSELRQKGKNIQPMEGGLKPLTARVGGKVLLKKKLVDEYFPPSNSYSTYVEPFVGGGAVYFYKDKDNHKEIVNDIDPDIYEIFKGFQQYDSKKIAETVNGDYTKKDFEKLRDAEPTTDFDKFIKTFLLYRLSFFGRGKTFGKPRINSSFENYKERLKDTTILNQDYREVIKKYDGKDTFFYLDPPVRESTGRFYFPAVNPEELVNTLKNIKGRFLLSWADTKIKKDLFKDFNIFTVKTKYVGEKTKGSQSKQVKEYIITNYEPNRTRGGAIPSNNTLHKMEKASYSMNPEDIIDMYQLVETTPTMKLYRNNNINIVAIRGTDVSDPIDLEADLLIPIGRLRDSTRFKRDLDTLKAWKQKYGPGEWYGVGHSLGGAILDEFLLMDLLQEGISYNPAVSYTNIPKKIKNKRIYKSEDPLYKVMGQFTENPEVRQTTEKSDAFINRKEHSIKQFEGGSKMDKFHKQLEKVGLDHETYMKAVKVLAKRNGYDPSKVEMSDDGIHKLVYHSPEGLKRFGRVGYGDFIIWSQEELNGNVPKGYADQKRYVFRKSHGKIKDSGKYSPNQLSINLLW
jgi:DNA adenine methylase